MKKLLVAAVIAIIVPCVLLGQGATKAPAKGNAAEQKVAALEREWIDAGPKGDAAWFERYLAPTFVNTDESGAVADKAAMIKEVRSREAKLESVSYEALNTKAYGDTVIATGITVRKGTLKGADISGRFAWTDTWVKLGGEWQCVAGHASTVSAK